MSKPRKKQGNPDFRHRVTSPAPTSEEIESRLIELLTPGTFANLKNVKDKQRSLRDRVLTLPVMAAQQVCDLYRRRWKIEDAFLLTKRLLGLSYLWVGGVNGVQMQIYATWIFYAVLNDLCADIAVALQQPIDQISVEMVFRSLYFFNRARSHNPLLELIPWLVEHQRSMGLVKAVRQRHRRTAAMSLDIWASALT